MHILWSIFNHSSMYPRILLKNGRLWRGFGEEITYRIGGQMLLIYDAKAFTDKCTFCLRFSANAILMLISSSLEFHKLFSVRTSAWLRSLAWIKRSICNQQSNWGFSIVHVFKAYPLFNNATWKNMAKLYVGNVREHFALLPSTLARVIGTFWPGTKLRTATGQEPARRMVPNTQWGRKTEVRSYPEKRKKKKKAGNIGPSASSVTPNASHSITQSCFSYQHWRAFWTWVSWFSSPPFLPYPKRFETKMRKTCASCPTHRSLHRFFSAYQPLHMDMWLHCSSAALQRRHTLQSRLFSARLLHRQGWSVKSSLYVNIS